MPIRDRLRPPPSGISGEVGDWLRDVWVLLNDTPQLSYFSGITPNSALTGLAGDLAVNIGSASTTTLVWQKTGSNTVPSRTGWVTLATGPT